MTNRIVDKIGGSSMAWPAEAKNIVTAGAGKRIVVVSAPGADDVQNRPARMTEMLKAYDTTGSLEQLAAIQERFAAIALRGRSPHELTQSVLAAIPTDIERARSYGEPVDPLGESWMAQLFAGSLGDTWRYLPAKDILHFADDGSFDVDQSRRALSAIDPNLNYVVDGNQGRSAEGKVVRIGDGGSDVSAAYIRLALGPGTLRLHSDVDGYKTVDPNLPEHDEIVRVVQDVPYVSYREASQLGKFGNGLVHYAVSQSLRGSGSTTELYATKTGRNGTLLLDSRPNVAEQPIVGITGEKEVIKVQLQQIGSEDEYGTTLRFRKDLKKFGIPFHSTTTDDDSESIYTSGKHRESIERAFANNASITVLDDIASISIVGEGMPRERALYVGQALLALHDYKIPFESGTSDGISATLLVPRPLYYDAIDVIHASVIQP